MEYKMKRFSQKPQRRKLFSKMEDEDYLGEQEDRKKSVKHAKGIGTAGGALLGGAAGASIGQNFGRRGALIGTAAGVISGAGLGRMAGKNIKKNTEKDANEKIKTYKNASPHDKKYIREKHEKEKDREIQRRQARAMEQTAWNTF